MGDGRRAACHAGCRLLTSTWDQTLACWQPRHAAGAEWVASEWLLDLIGLPATSAVGFVTGAMMANFTCLAAARHEVLRRVGWNVERDGLYGGPQVSVVVGEERHETVDVALRFLVWARHPASWYLLMIKVGSSLTLLPTPSVRSATTQ